MIYPQFVKISQIRPTISSSGAQEDAPAEEQRYAYMKTDNITEIGIDEAERLYVKPASADFRFIYRAAMEVNWSEEGKFLYSPKPRDWLYLNWYKQIHVAAKDEYGICLVITENTKWVSIDDELKKEIATYTATNA